MARQVLPIVGAVVGAFFGSPQIGYAIGAVVGNLVDPVINQGPKIGETGAQTSQEGAPRAIIFATASCTGNIIAAGPIIKSTETEDVDGGKGSEKSENEHAYRNYAIRICEGPIAGILRIWEDDKLVYDIRVGSLMLAESSKWIANKNVFFGDETQLPSAFLNLNVPPLGDHPAHRGTAYIVFGLEDLTDRRGSIPQYRFEVAREVSTALGGYHEGPSSTDSYGTYLTLDQSGRPIMLRGQTGAEPEWAVGLDGQYEVAQYDPDSFVDGAFPQETTLVINLGDTPGDDRIWPIAIDDQGRAVSFDANFGHCNLILNGSWQTKFRPDSSAPPGWWFNEAGFYPEYGGLVWFGNGSIYIGVRKTNGIAWDSIYRFPQDASGEFTNAIATAASITGDTTAPIFWMHVSREGKVRAMSAYDAGVVKVYDASLGALAGVTAPAAIAARFPNTGAIHAFGFDEALGYQVYLLNQGGAMHAQVYDLAGNLVEDFTLVGAENSITNRIVFASEAIYIQTHHKTFKIDTPQTLSGQPMLLGDIVAEIHERCNVPGDKFDVSELTDEVAGLVLAGDYSGADAINTLRGPYFFDKAEYSKKLHYPKRGAAVVTTLTIDDLVEEPDLSKREQAVEFAKKMHLFYQHAISGYAAVKATSLRSSPDARVVGETSLQVPVVLNEDQAAQTVSKLHKVSWAEAEGEVTLSLPESFIRLIPSNNVGLVLRGQAKRLRIEKREHESGVLKYTLRHDRQSAYTSNLTGVPIPPPSLPPSTIVGYTTLAILDISSRIDTQDDLHYLSAGVGALPAWYGYALQRSLDGGANYVTVGQYGASIIGELLEDVPAASEFYTDTTNAVYVKLIRDGQSLQALTDQQFLSEQGAFALEKADRSWEIMQYRDAVQDSSGAYILKMLHRGLLNSGVSAHTAGAKFVMLERVQHIPAVSAWIGQPLTHRAVSLGDSPELASAQTATYYGRSQIEWPVAYLQLSRDGSDNITASWTPRHRFGTEDAPVASINFQGYRVVLDDGSSTVSFDTLSPGFVYDASALGSVVTVGVSALNRITGAGPSTSGAI